MVKKAVTIFLMIVLATSLLATEIYADVPMGQVLPDTWVAVDDLGRTVENRAEIKKADGKNRFVGVFFWDWHDMYADNGAKPKNLTQIMESNPGIERDYNNSVWEGASEGFFWNTFTTS